MGVPTPFLLRAHTDDGAEDVTARAVIDTWGTYAHPDSKIIGAGHSAANRPLALADLAEQQPETRITWLIRNANATVVGRFEIVRLGCTDDG